MVMNIVSQFRWWDIFIVILSLRICYIALKSGFAVELFKLLGTLAAIYLSLHYYIPVSDTIQSKISISPMPVETLDFLVFLALAGLGYLVFMLLRSIICRFIRLEAAVNLNRWGALLCGLTRIILLASLLSFALLISSVGYFNRSVKSSYLGSRFLGAAPAVYSWLWNNIASKFMLSEKFNTFVNEAQGNSSVRK